MTIILFNPRDLEIGGLLDSPQSSYVGTWVVDIASDGSIAGG